MVASRVDDRCPRTVALAPRGAPARARPRRRRHPREPAPPARPAPRGGRAAGAADRRPRLRRRRGHPGAHRRPRGRSRRGRGGPPRPAHRGLAGRASRSPRRRSPGATATSAPSSTRSPAPTATSWTTSAPRCSPRLPARPAGVRPAHLHPAQALARVVPGRHRSPRRRGPPRPRGAGRASSSARSIPGGAGSATTGCSASCSGTSWPSPSRPSCPPTTGAAAVPQAPGVVADGGGGPGARARVVVRACAALLRVRERRVGDRESRPELSVGRAR